LDAEIAAQCAVGENAGDIELVEMYAVVLEQHYLDEQEDDDCGQTARQPERWHYVRAALHDNGRDAPPTSTDQEQHRDDGRAEQASRVDGKATKSPLHAQPVRV
jgi:hypothetical protein